MVMSTTTYPMELADILRHSSHPTLRKLQVEQVDDKITLSGRVSSYYLKQLAQETVMAARPGCELVNRITVGAE